MNAMQFERRLDARMPPDEANEFIPLSTDRPIWNRFYGALPLVTVVGKEEEASRGGSPCELRSLPG